MKILIFKPKMDPGGQKSIFGQKIESSIFRPKFADKSSLHRCLNSRFGQKIKNLNYRPKFSPGLEVKKIESTILDQNWPKNDP